jgi:hypothetical protein
VTIRISPDAQQITVGTQAWDAGQWADPDTAHALFRAAAALKPPPGNPFWIDVTDEGVSMQYHSRQVLFWNYTEWEEDPDVVLTIANACRMALEEPGQLLDYLRNRGLIR